MVALGSVFSLTLKKISWKSWLSQSYISPFFSIISFQSGNADSLSKKIHEVINLDTLTLELMGKEGRKNVINRFNIEKMCLNTYSEYKKLFN